MATLAVHPAALVHVRPGSRKPAVTFVACRTPVEPVEADLRDMAPIDRMAAVGIGWDSGRLPPHVISGTGPIPWALLRDADGVPVEAARFLGALASPEDGGAKGIVPRGTPARAWGHPRSANEPGDAAWTTRGEDLPPARVGRVERDGRDEAAVAVQRWLAQNYRVVGDDVWVRMAFMVHGSLGGGHAFFDSALDAVRNATRLRHVTDILTGGADYGDAIAYGRRFGPVDDRSAFDARAWRSIVGDADAGAGAAAVADCLPSRLRRAVNRCADLRRRWGQADFAEELKALSDSLVPLEIDGITGLHACGVRPDVPATLRAVREAAQALLARPSARPRDYGNPYENDLDKVRAMVGNIDRFHLPTARSPDAPVEDVTALEALGP